MKTIYLVTATGPDYGGEYRYVAAETEEHAWSAALLMDGEVEVEEIKLYEATDALPIEKVTAYTCMYFFGPALDELGQELRGKPGELRVTHSQQEAQPAEIMGPAVEATDYPRGIGWSVRALGWRSAHIAEMVAAEEFNRQLVERGLTVRTSESVQ